jgi:molybdopterin-containing oxidoreductase family membrane subunit
MFIGTLIPLVVLTQPKLAKHNGWAGWMGLFLLIGYAVARGLIIFPALTVPEFKELITAFHDVHLSFDYFPSLMEWAVTAGIIGLSTLAFLVGLDRLALFTDYQADTLAEKGV